MVKSSEVYLQASECRTALGDSEETWRKLVEGVIALQPETPLDGCEERVPLALISPMQELTPPRWLALSEALLARAPSKPWGQARYPVIITSSNFGIDQMLAAHGTGDRHFETHATAERAVNAIAKSQGWGENRVILSNACVSAQLGMLHAQRLLENGLADEVLIFSFDTLSQFVVGGFHSLKILNTDFPQPYSVRESGAIGLGDGLAFAVLSREPSAYRLAGVATHSEFKHMTGNDPSGAGFDAVLKPLREIVGEHRVWLKGHGTGTLETGRLEAEAIHRAFPEAPLVSWKGSLGHTLGSCGLVEMAIARTALQEGLAPGTVGAEAPYCVPTVQPDAFTTTEYLGVIMLSSAFGGAHAAHLLIRE